MQSAVHENMKNDPLSAKRVCKVCGARWVDGTDACPWCGADEAGLQTQDYDFWLPEIKEEGVLWDTGRPLKVKFSKALVILLISAVIGLALYVLMPIVLALTILLHFVVLAMLAYILVSVGIAFGISKLFEKLVNHFGKGNSTWLAVITSFIIYIPGTLLNTIAFWNSGAVADIWSLIYGIAIPVLGIIGIALHIGAIKSGRFCPHCNAPVQRHNVLRIHSCNTEELIKRIQQNAYIPSYSDLSRPGASNHAYIDVEMFLCKNSNCRRAKLFITAHRMYVTQVNNEKKEVYMHRLVAEHELSEDDAEKWSQNISRTDRTAAAETAGIVCKAAA